MQHNGNEGRERHISNWRTRSHGGGSQRGFATGPGSGCTQSSPCHVSSGFASTAADDCKWGRAPRTRRAGRGRYRHQNTKGCHRCILRCTRGAVQWESRPEFGTWRPSLQVLPLQRLGAGWQMAALMNIRTDYYWGSSPADSGTDHEKKPPDLAS